MDHSLVPIDQYNVNYIHPTEVELINIIVEGHGLITTSKCIHAFIVYDRTMAIHLFYTSFARGHHSFEGALELEGESVSPTSLLKKQVLLFLEFLLVFSDASDWSTHGALQSGDEENDQVLHFGSLNAEDAEFGDTEVTTSHVV